MIKSAGVGKFDVYVQHLMYDDQAALRITSLRTREKVPELVGKGRNLLLIHDYYMKLKEAQARIKINKKLEK